MPASGLLCFLTKEGKSWWDLGLVQGRCGPPTPEEFMDSLVLLCLVISELTVATNFLM